MSMFDGRNRKTSIRKTPFPDYREYKRLQQGFLEAGCDETRSAPSALHFVPRCRCLQSALSRRQKLSFVPENLINSTLFAQEVIANTLELISNWRVEVDFIVNLILKPWIIRKFCFFSGYRGFPVLVDRNRNQIWKLHAKIHYLE